MKTAISIPDETFHRAERAAAELGVSRSQFYVSAVEQYMERLLDESITRQINEALALAGDDDSSAWASEAGRRLLSSDDENW